MWCNNCNRKTQNEICELCGKHTETDTPVEVYWCADCKVPIIKSADEIDKTICPLCGGHASYFCADLRPVFPEERLLLEIIQGKPFAYINDSVWASDNRYYINGKSTIVTSAFYKKATPQKIQEQLMICREQNNYTEFNAYIDRFIAANKIRLNSIVDEAKVFVADVSAEYQRKEIVISFSGGKDSTVTADVVVKSLSDPSLVHIYGDTTLEFPSTYEYAERFRTDNLKAIFKVARNNDNDFYDVCEDIGPPARMLRWCCSMFKTGPITRILNRLYGEKSILTFYGIRKCESLSRGKYSRDQKPWIEQYDENGDLLRDENGREVRGAAFDAVKIQKQRVASPIFNWKDIDVWLYILSTGIDFNDAYRLGYDRVGCWCCPNNNSRAQFLAQIYLPEQFNRWREFLVRFAKRIGKPDADEYIDSGAWKARQGGNGVAAAQDIKIRYTNCTTEDNAKVYQLNKPIDGHFCELFIPFGKIAPELGRKMINEIIIVDLATSVPILSIQPFSHEGYEYAVKVKTMNVVKHDSLQRMVSYQIKKYNACRKCLKCESLCKHRAISINNGIYRIDTKRCVRCKMCVTSKYLEGGCLMEKYLKTKG